MRRSPERSYNSPLRARTLFKLQQVPTLVGAIRRPVYPPCIFQKESVEACRLAVFVRGKMAERAETERHLTVGHPAIVADGLTARVFAPESEIRRLIESLP